MAEDTRLGSNDFGKMVAMKYFNPATKDKTIKMLQGLA